MATRLGQVDYRLTRDSVVREYRRGRLSRVDVCDAHAELLRVAANHGRPTSMQCPICEADQLVLVSYVFGARLPPGGRVVASSRELSEIARRQEVVCYVVEVCRSCSWNHLLRMFTPPAKQQ